VEVLVAVVLVALALAPALEALPIGAQGAALQETETIRHYHLLAKLEEVLAAPFDDLVAESVAAGGAPSAWSDAAGTSDRRLVYLLGYDADDADLDGDPATGADPGILRVRAELEDTAQRLETLTAP
jgi:hypothetical protein